MKPCAECYCDKGFRDALDMLAFQHWECVTCGIEICGGGPNHKGMGHVVRALPEGYETTHPEGDDA